MTIYGAGWVNLSDNTVSAALHKSVPFWCGKLLQYDHFFYSYFKYSKLSFSLLISLLIPSLRLK